MLRTRQVPVFFFADVASGIVSANPVAAAGVATVSAVGASCAAADPVAAAGVATVSGVGATAGGIQSADPVSAAGVATVSAVASARAASNPVAAQGVATVSGVGSDASAPPPATPGAARSRLRGTPAWAGPTLAELARDQDDDELLEIVAALAAAGVLDGVSGLPGARRV